jgi:hypothetical protein
VQVGEFFSRKQQSRSPVDAPLNAAAQSFSPRATALDDSGEGKVVLPVRAGKLPPLRRPHRLAPVYLIGRPIAEAESIHRIPTHVDRHQGRAQVTPSQHRAAFAAPSSAPLPPQPGPPLAPIPARKDAGSHSWAGGEGGFMRPPSPARIAVHEIEDAARKRQIAVNMVRRKRKNAKVNLALRGSDSRLRHMQFEQLPTKPHPSPQYRLPACCRTLGYITCFVWCVGCSFIILVYGLKFDVGDAEAAEAVGTVLPPPVVFPS